jgi:hypothetical protein
MSSTPGSIRLTTTLLLRLLRIRLARPDDDTKLNDDQIQAIPPTSVDQESDVRLTIYLYSVSNSGALNTDRTQYSGATREKTDLAVELRYLLMAFPDSTAENETEGVMIQHELLGKAMQTLYDAETIEADELPGQFQDEGVTITLEERDPMEITELWSTFSELPLNPCATYVVRPIKIPSTQGTPFSEVEDRDLDVSRGIDDDDDDGADDEDDRMDMGI